MGGRHLRIGLIGAGALLCLAAAAQAQTRAPEWRDPEWIARPDGEVFAENYPPAALAQGVVGRVMLECAVLLDTTAHCAVSSETPLYWGFGDAALAIGRSFRFRPTERDGVPVEGGRVRIPVRFSMAAYDNTHWFAAIMDTLAPEARVDLPSWEQAPNAQMVELAYPRAAQEAGLVGRGVLGCLINPDRTLACEIDRESPEGHGFGAAALTLAPRFVVNEADSAFIAAHAGEKIFLPINFGAPPELTPLHTFYSGRGPFRLRVTAPPEISNLGASATIRCVMRTPQAPRCVTEQQSVALDEIEQMRAAAETPESGIGFVPGDELVVELRF
ncbi:MAG: energy transducer TonB [Terricaulis sp.]|nr:energy transducer TonB [Terricaulis sp.]